MFQLSNIAEIVAAVDLPVNADFESGYAHQPEGVAENVRRCVETGVAGLSIEDATGDRRTSLCDLPLAVERIAAARTAIDVSGSGDLLTARAECFLVGHPEPLRESIRCLQAYAEAGADVLCAPGPREREDSKAIVGALSPKPVNVLMSSNTGLRFPISRNWDCGASASAPHLRALPGAASSALPRRSRRRAPSQASTAQFPLMSSTTSFERIARPVSRDNRATKSLLAVYFAGASVGGGGVPGPKNESSTFTGVCFRKLSTACLASSGRSFFSISGRTSSRVFASCFSTRIRW